jgi:predicted amidohydrolase
MAFGPDVARNLATMEAAIKRLARRRADLAVFPECCMSDYVVPPGERDWDAIRAGMRELSKLARSAKMALVYGTAERNGRRKPFNSALALDRRGRIVSRYRKAHMFPWDRPLFSPGRRRPGVFRLAGLRVVVQICYDLRFPELPRLAALRGAQLVTYSLAAATADAWKRPVMEAHVLSRAAENSIYAVAANRAHRVMMMRSAIVDPDGRELARAPAARSAELVAEIDPRAADRKHLRDRRGDLYSLGPR